MQQLRGSGEPERRKVSLPPVRICRGRGRKHGAECEEAGDYRCRWHLDFSESLFAKIKQVIRARIRINRGRLSLFHQEDRVIVPDIKQKEGQAVPYGIRRRMEEGNLGVCGLGMPGPCEHVEEELD